MKKVKRKGKRKKKRKKTISNSDVKRDERKTDMGKVMTVTHEESKKSILDYGKTAAKKYKFEELEPTHRPIFSLKTSTVKTEERFKMSAQEYLDHFKIATILQDTFKTILDRREENARDLFIQYLEATLNGEHILLREHAFVNATPLNRKCFLQQVRKVFHCTPCYKIVTGLDYLQLLTLI